MYVGECWKKVLLIQTVRHLHVECCRHLPAPPHHPVGIICTINVSKIMSLSKFWNSLYGQNLPWPPFAVPQIQVTSLQSDYCQKFVVSPPELVPYIGIHTINTQHCFILLFFFFLIKWAYLFIISLLCPRDLAMLININQEHSFWIFALPFKRWPAFSIFS